MKTKNLGVYTESRTNGWAVRLTLAVALGLIAVLAVSGVLVVWADKASTDHDIRGQQVLPTGALEGNTYPIAWETQDEHYPQVTTDGTSEPFTIWERDNGGASGYDLYGKRRRLTISPSPLLEADANQRLPVVAGDGAGSYLTVWYDDRGGDNDIYARLIESGSGLSITITPAITGSQSSPKVAYNLDDDEYLVVWQDYRAGADNPDIYAQRVSGAGLLVGGNFAVTTAPYRQTSPHVAYAEGQGVYLVAWRHYTSTSNLYFDVYGQLISHTGALAGAPLAIANRNGSTADRESPTDIIYNSTLAQFLVLWNDLRAGLWNVWGRHVTPVGAMEAETQITFLNARHESQAAGAYDPDDDQYLIVWKYRHNPGDPGDIRARRMTGSGVVTATETLYIATGSTPQDYPDVTYLAEAGEYVVVWEDEWVTHTQNDVCGRLVSPAGKLEGYLDPITWETPGEYRPQITTGSAGEAFVVWERDNGGGSGYDLYGGRLRVAVSTFPILEADANQRRPTVDGDGAEGYLVAWYDDRNGDNDIYARLVEPGNSYSITIAQATGDQNIPQVAYNPDDDEYLVVWQDYRAGADNPDIYAQRVSGEEGVLIGGNFTVTAAPYRQMYPHVAYAEGQGVYLAVWRHYPGTSNDYYDVYGQLISNTGLLAGDPLAIANRSSGYADRESPTDIIYNSASGQFLVLWNDLRTGCWDVWGRHVTTAGTMETETQITFLNHEHETQAAGAYNSDDDQYLIVWKHRDNSGILGDIRGRRMTGSGVVTTTETLSIATGSTLQGYPDVAYLAEAGRYTVVWDDTWTKYDLTVNAVGSGAVALDPVGGIYPENMVITLTAMPDVGWYFVNWTGGLSGSTNPTTILMDSDKVVMATFNVIPCVEVSGIAMTLDTTGDIYTDTVVDFGINIAPDTVSAYTYTVDYEGTGPSTPVAGSADPLALSHTFAATGDYTVAVAVWNCDMTAMEALTDTVDVTVIARPEMDFEIFLPLVMRNF